MLTNTLLLYVTREALAKARDRLSTRKDDAAEGSAHEQPDQTPAWQLQQRRGRAKLRSGLRN